MFLLNRQHQLLEILAENLNNPRPDLMQSEKIANQLNMTETETKQILKSMHGMGVVESDMEGEYCLITQSGLQLVQSQTSAPYYL